MKILYYSPHPHLSYAAQTGYGTHMREMVKAMREAGAEVELLIIGGETAGSGHTKATSPGVLKRIAKVFVPSFVWRSLKEIKLKKTDADSAERLEKAIVRFQPDLVYERTAWMSDSGRRVTARHKVLHFCEVNAPFEYEVRQFEGSRSWTEKTGRKMFRNVVSTCSHVFTVSSSLRDHLVKEFGVDVSKISVEPNAIDAGEVRVDRKKVQEIKSRYNLDGCVVTGFVGSIFPYHGVDELITAFAIVHRKRKDSALLIVGDGLIIDALKQLSRERGCEGAVHFTGSVPKSEVFNYISAMDVAVLAKTNWYCSPIKLFEYGFLAKPVIAPDIQAVRDVMDESCGWLIEPGTGQLEKTLEHIIADLPASNAKAALFAERIAKFHTWSINAHRVLEVYYRKAQHAEGSKTKSR